MAERMFLAVLVTLAALAADGFRDPEDIIVSEESVADIFEGFDVDGEKRTIVIGESAPLGSASLAFVFDTTGSMYDDLVQVIDGAAKILATTLAMREKPLYNYVLVPFHDPGLRAYSLIKVNIG